MNLITAVIKPSTATRPTHHAAAPPYPGALAIAGLLLLTVVMLLAATSWTPVDRNPTPTSPPGVGAPQTPTAAPFGQA